MHALKYESRFAIASMMGRLMAGPASQLSADTIVPVPLHASRRRERGYDQAALLARASARELDIEVLAALQRVRKTRQQVDLSPAERRENVAGAFHANHQFAGDTIILVDDVFTTGSTMRSAARTLLDAGAGTVYGLTFGLAMPGSDRTATTLPRAGRKSP
ncbi:MAG TPA: phosphoribosyltransferase family protein [Chloroflexota bacterium]